MGGGVGGLERRYSPGEAPRADGSFRGITPSLGGSPRGGAVPPRTSADAFDLSRAIWSTGRLGGQPVGTGSLAAKALAEPVPGTGCDEEGGRDMVVAAASAAATFGLSCRGEMQLEGGGRIGGRACSVDASRDGGIGGCGGRWNFLEERAGGGEVGGGGC